jgi:hypothetical protein
MVVAPAPPRLVIVGATGWYGKTLLHEYVLAYGEKEAAENLLLYASRPSLIGIEIQGRRLEFAVADLAEVAQRPLNDYDGLVWYAFILRNKISAIGAEAYRVVNERIANYVFSCLDANPRLRITFFSSGAAYGLDECPAYEADPYVHLKIHYQRELSRRGTLVTFYPYATLGKYVSDLRSFAAASFIQQAIATGCIVVDAKVPVARSYGSVHDFSRLLLRLYGFPDWTCDFIPSIIVPVTHTLDLFQLAHEVAAAVRRDIEIVYSAETDALPSVYVASDYSYGAQLSRFGLAPTPLTQQLRDMSEGDAFCQYINRP